MVVDYAFMLVTGAVCSLSSNATVVRSLSLFAGQSDLEGRKRAVLSDWKFSVSHVLLFFALRISNEHILWGQNERLGRLILAL